MKYALIFAATAAAYEAYGGYGADVESSSAVKPSTSAKPIGYTTIVPGYGKQPVTVTTQHQPYPTCVSPAYGGKDCAKWDEDAYVSTVIKDYDNNYATITKTAQPVVVYHTKKTITHSATATSGYAAPTGVAYKNGTEGCWYELYEKIEEVPYNQLGPHALPGYPGSGLYKEGEKKQPVNVKEYKGGKWSEYVHEYSYGTPKPEVTTYEKPGVYTIPSKDVTIDHPVTYPAEATKTAKAGETCTYGGQSIEAKQTGYITGAYAAYETKVNGGKTVTETVIKHTTIYASTTGNYEVAKPTTTVYDHDTEVAYPTAKHYEAGVYHHEAQTVTITKPGQAYTCEYEQTKKHEATSTPKKSTDHSAYPTSVPAHDNSYGHNKPSSTPKQPTEGQNNYPSYPATPNKPTEGEHNHPSYPATPEKPTEGESNYPSYPSTPKKPVESESNYPSYPAGPVEGHSSSVQESYPTSAPATIYTKPSYNGGNAYGETGKSTMATVSSKENAYPESTPAYGAGSSAPAYGPDSSAPAYGTASSAMASSTPCESSSASSTTAKSSAYSASTPAFESSIYSASKPAEASSTPCESSTASVTPAKSSAYSASTPANVYTKPSYNGNTGYGENVKSTLSTISTKPYPASTPVEHYPASASSTPCESSTASMTPAKSSDVYSQATPSPAESSAYSTQAYGEASSTPVKPTSAPAYDNTPYPAGATSTPCESSDKPSATPYVPAAYQPAPAEGYSKPQTGYAKRGGLNERRKIAAAN
ncbi:hypothetical protein AALT_g2499 [Alternaria alternata]|nr:hypothetical protein AALT_g2499 [Alternaria alternata]